jgi:hypothetical protein
MTMQGKIWINFDRNYFFGMEAYQGINTFYF